ncbi:MAG: hypothetical protein E7653_06235 [Ruminococcaceae bacterium]|nr:hypothetical protein [Oscillospiraceae bacterium]
MSKNLSNILTVFKVVKVLAQVVFVFSIIGCAGCVLGLMTLPMAGAMIPTGLLSEVGLDLLSAYQACIVGAIVCVGELIFAIFAKRYFKNVLDAGTPFTFDGAKESFRLGIASIIISAATSVIAGIVSLGFLAFSSPLSTESDASVTFSLTTGLIFLFLSMVFKHGAELREANAQQAAQMVAQQQAFAEQEAARAKAEQEAARAQTEQSEEQPETDAQSADSEAE